jgi:dienelactone hydrolase
MTQKERRIMHPLMVLGGAVGVALALSIPLVVPRPASAQDGAMQAPRIIFLPDGAGRALLRLPEDLDEVQGIVIVVPDGRAEDTRAAPYIAALLAGGIAVLQLGVDPDRRDEAAQVRAIDSARAAIRADPTLARLRIGAIGFGQGARAVLAHGGRRQVAALHPWCAALPELPDNQPLYYVAQLVLLATASDPADRPEACVKLAEFDGRLIDLAAGTAIGPARGSAPRGFGEPAQARLRGDADEAIARVVWFLADLMAPRPDADALN